MKSLKGSFVAKTAAIILCYFTMFLTAASVISIAVMGYSEFYTKPKSAVTSDIMIRLAGDETYTVYSRYMAFDVDTPHYFEDANFYYTIEDSFGNLLSGNYNGEDYSYYASREYNQFYGYGEDGAEFEKGAVTVNIYLKNSFTQTDIFSVTDQFLNIGYSMRYGLFAIAFFSLLVTVLLIVFLFCAAGHRDATGTITLNPIDKIPFDIYTVAVFLAFLLNLMILENITLSYMAIVFIIIIIMLLYTFDFLLLTSYCMSFATRVKRGTLIKRTAIYIVLSWIFKAFSALIRGIGFIFSNLSFIKKTVIALAAVCFVELIVVLSTMYSGGAVLGWWFFGKVIFVPVILLIAIALNRLKKGGEIIAGGNLGYQIDTAHMYGDFKRFGESLNHINTGMQAAVNEKMRSERMKTELITNVSHDIKTPLTSIINYVDLIKKEKPENETIDEYIVVLDRQSARLKKLIEDLVEASKASTGNLTVNLVPCDVGVLLSQTAGEYDERLAAGGLQPVLNIPTEPVVILADGRHLWRVLENLMNNICKYAQNDTRVYLDLTQNDGEVNITFRNISKCALNISSEELMERFVRGDSSRSTEGSGLGLSIAKSLTELQGGRLRVLIDGDLFKVVLTFKSYEERKL